MDKKMNEQQIKLFQSKKSDNWATPKKLYNELNSEFNFDFDPCPLNSDFDGLQIDWGKRNFINPPYSNVIGFLKKAHYELKFGNAELCVFLTFSNTDTKWFHNYCYGIGELRFIKGRLKFEDENGNAKNSAMRPSMLVIFRKKNFI
jgi:site-specific DNA-methyltransferase (adenine-specific)|tara:strand:+ start:1008 stop:1445 length:438 start_codon:yes stop_codon:yes gene_type:complete